MAAAKIDMVHPLLSAVTPTGLITGLGPLYSFTVSQKKANEEEALVLMPAYRAVYLLKVELKTTFFNQLDTAYPETQPVLVM